MLVLSLFPGVGLLDKAFEDEGYCIVRGPDVIFGGDIRQFHPPAGKFDGVIGGPPCQSFSSLVHLVRANGNEPKFGNLIPEFERCVAAAQPDWFIMENVRAAPEPTVAGYQTHSFLLDNSWLPGDDSDGFGQEQMRLRRFTFGRRGRPAEDLRRWIDTAVFMLPDPERTATQWTPASIGCGNCGLCGRCCKCPTAHVKTRRQAVVSDPSAVPVKIGGSGKVKRTVTGGGTLTPGAELKREGERTKDPRRNSRRDRFADALRLQGLPADFLEHAPFTAEGKLNAVANGVPLPMGRAIAKAVKEAIEGETS
jgi:DNA (cytosine-5)-methyltransferase 1